MTRVKNQHYVPQTYLRNFSSQGEKIWVFDKTTQTSFETSIKNIASETHFYDAPELARLSGVDQLIEQSLAVVEGDYSKCVEDLLASIDKGTFTQLSGQQRDTLAEFLILQNLRTRESLEHTKQLIDAYQLIEQKCRFPLSVSEISDEREFLAMRLLDESAVLDLINTIRRHIWIVSLNRFDIPYYTSDHPVVRYAYIRYPLVTMSGLGSKGVEIACPLSPECMLVLLERSYHKSMAMHDGEALEISDPKYVIRHNGMQVRQAYRQVYCNENQFEHAAEELRESPRSADIKRKRVEVR